MNKTSINKLVQCHPDLIRLARAVDEEIPIQCICGHRSDVEQTKAYNSGTSMLKWPNSKHNSIPSMAADFVPDPDKNPATIDWSDIDCFNRMCDKFEEVAKKLDIKIRLGRDFKFKDFPHIELV